MQLTSTTFWWSEKSTFRLFFNKKKKKIDTIIVTTRFHYVRFQQNRCIFLKLYLSFILFSSRKTCWVNLACFSNDPHTKIYKITIRLWRCNKFEIDKPHMAHLSRSRGLQKKHVLFLSLKLLKLNRTTLCNLYDNLVSLFIFIIALAKRENWYY